MLILKQTMAGCSIMCFVLTLHALMKQNNGRQDGSCKDGWKTWKDSCYYFSNQTQTWLEALNQCKTFDNTSYLTDVLSKEENDYLESQIKIQANLHQKFTTYVGCFNDTSNRLLDGKRTKNPRMTNKLCIDFCRNYGYRYAGTEYGKECFCGMKTDKCKEKPISECNITCSGGNKSERCGDYWRISVHKISNAYWLGGICIKKNTNILWFESRKSVTGYTHWEANPGPCNVSTCIHMGHVKGALNSYKWTADDCLDENLFICKSSVKSNTAGPPGSAVAQGTTVGQSSVPRCLCKTVAPPATTAGPFGSSTGPQNTTSAPSVTITGLSGSTTGRLGATAAPPATIAGRSGTTSGPLGTTAGSPETTNGPPSTTSEPPSTTAGPQDKIPTVVLTHDQLEKNIKKLKKELTLNKSTLSKSIRKKTSVSDHRKSSKYMGCMAGGIIAFIFAVIFISDLPLLFQHAKCVWRNIRHLCQR